MSWHCPFISFSLRVPYQQLTVLDISAGALQAAQLLTRTRETHVSPFEPEQKFIYCYCRME